MASYSVRIPSFFTPKGATHIEYKLLVTHVSDSSWGKIQFSVRYSKILALHNQIQDAVRGIASIPQFPGKKVLGSRSYQFIQDRGLALEKYLRALLALLPSSRFEKEYHKLQDFLGIPQHEAQLFRRRRREEDTKSRKLKATRTLFESFGDGRAKLGPDGILKMLRTGYSPTYVDRYRCLKQFQASDTHENIEKCWISRRRFINTMLRYAGSHATGADFEVEFQKYDENGDGVLAGAEIDSFICDHYFFDPAHIHAIAAVFGDGTAITFRHFQRMMQLIDDDISVLTTRKLIGLCEKIEEEIQHSQRQAIDELRNIEGVFALVSSQLRDAAPQESTRGVPKYSKAAWELIKQQKTQEALELKNKGNEKPRSILKQGYLAKRGKLNTSWRDRFVRLWDDGFMTYHKSEKKKHEKSLGRIDLSDAKVSTPKFSESDLKDNGYVFRLAAGTRVYKFHAIHNGLRSEWISAIQEQIDIFKTRASQRSVDDASLPTRGWLEKKGKINKAYRMRFFRLVLPEWGAKAGSSGPVFGSQQTRVRSPELRYYKSSASGAKCTGTIHLAKMEVGKANLAVRMGPAKRSEATKDSHRTFHVMDTRARATTLRAIDETMAENWVKTLRKAIESHAARKEEEEKQKPKPEIPVHSDDTDDDGLDVDDVEPSVSASVSQSAYVSRQGGEEEEDTDDTDSSSSISSHTSESSASATERLPQRGTRHAKSYINPLSPQRGAGGLAGATVLRTVAGTRTPAGLRVRDKTKAEREERREKKATKAKANANAPQTDQERPSASSAGMGDEKETTMHSSRIGHGYGSGSGYRSARPAGGARRAVGAVTLLSDKSGSASPRSGAASPSPRTKSASGRKAFNPLNVVDLDDVVTAVPGEGLQRRGSKEKLHFLRTQRLDEVEFEIQNLLKMEQDAQRALTDLKNREAVSGAGQAPKKSAFGFVSNTSLRRSPKGSGRRLSSGEAANLADLIGGKQVTIDDLRRQRAELQSQAASLRQELSGKIPSNIKSPKRSPHTLAPSLTADYLTSPTSGEATDIDELVGNEYPEVSTKTRKRGNALDAERRKLEREKQEMDRERKRFQEETSRQREKMRQEIRLEMEADLERERKAIEREFEAKLLASRTKLETERARALKEAREKTKRESEQIRDAHMKDMEELRARLERAGKSAVQQREEIQKAKEEAEKKLERKLKQKEIEMEAKLEEARQQAKKQAEAELKKQLETVRNEAMERERASEQELSAMKTRLLEAEENEKAENRRLEEARRNLERERDAISIRSKELTNAQRREWAEREKQLKSEVQRLSEEVKKENEKSRSLRYTQQELKNRAQKMKETFRLREERMRTGFEQMKARVTSKVRTRENELLGEIDSLKGHLKAALEMQRNANEALESSKQQLRDMERQHAREELAWLELRRDLTAEEQERREQKQKQYEEERSKVQSRITRETEAKISLEATQEKLHTLQRELDDQKKESASSSTLENHSSRAVFGMYTHGRDRRGKKNASPQQDDPNMDL